MEKLCAIGRFMSAVVRSYVRSYQPDIVLESVTDESTGQDITANALARLAMSLPLSDSPTAKTVVRYTYKGTGPYQYRGLTFPPPLPKREIVPPNEQIIMAELQTAAAEEGDILDVTEDVIAYAGPDGTFHGNQEDPMGACSYVGTLEITYADGGTNTYSKE